jgi:hypothetical protein
VIGVAIRHSRLPGEAWLSRGRTDEDEDDGCWIVRDLDAL